MSDKTSIYNNEVPLNQFEGLTKRSESKMIASPLTDTNILKYQKSSKQCFSPELNPLERFVNVDHENLREEIVKPPRKIAS